MRPDVKILLCLLFLAVPAHAGSMPTTLDPAPVVPAIAPVYSGNGDSTLTLGGTTLTFGLPVAIATLNYYANIEADGSPTPCLSHVKAVHRLVEYGFSYTTGVPVDTSGWTVQTVRSSRGVWQAHASALVTANGRQFLLDNGALRLNAGRWLEVTGADMSRWDINSQ